MHLVPNATKIHQQTNVAEELKEAQSWKKTERRNEEGGTALWVKVRVRKPLAEDSCGLKILQRQSKTSTTNTELGQA